MTCPNCQAAETAPHYAFRASCPGCVARGVGRGPNFADSARYGFLTAQYRAELQKLGLTHNQVKEARAKDYEAMQAVGVK